MNRSTYLLTGIIGSFALSVYAMVIVPQQQLGGLAPQFTLDEDKITDIYPIENAGIVKGGREVYASLGCIYCHSQQIRDEQNGLDLERGWGTRRTVARDYIFDNPPFLGTSRLGPDLSNYGAAKWRNEAENEYRDYKPKKRDAAWNYVHLYNPRVINPDSNMPAYKYLFKKQKITGQRSVDALDVPVEDGFEIIPKPEARTLVGYLLSLDKSHPLKEVKSAAPAPAAAK